MLQIQKGAELLNVVDDKLGTPTCTHDFARNAHVLIESGNYGVYNMVCDEDCSRYDVAVEIVNILGLESKITVEKVKSDFFQQEYFGPDQIRKS